MSKRNLIIILLIICAVAIGTLLYYFLGIGQNIAVPNTIQNNQGDIIENEILNNEDLSAASGYPRVISSMDSPDGKKRFELYSDKASCKCYSEAKCSISIIDTDTHNEIERFESIEQGLCPLFPTGGIPIKWHDNESLVVNFGKSDQGESINEFSVYNLTERKTTEVLWSSKKKVYNGSPLTFVSYNNKNYIIEENNGTVTIYETNENEDEFTKNSSLSSSLDYSKLEKKTSIQAQGDLLMIPRYTGIYFKIGTNLYQYDSVKSEITQIR